MGPFFKVVAYSLAGLVALIVLAVVLVSLVVDPNDLRDSISASVKDSTGRELVIEGDVDLSVFPWLAVDVGKAQLGNAPGFGDQPFASFEQARLSVRLLPLLLSREVRIGTAELDALTVNLAVDRSGRSNWQDLADEQAAPAPETDARNGRGVSLDISSINVSNANFVYDNAQSGERYTVSDVNMKSGRVAAGEAIPFDGSLSFELQPAGISGDVELETVLAFDADTGAVSFDDLRIAGVYEGLASVPASLAVAAPAIEINTKEQRMAPGELAIEFLDVNVRADVEPFSYAATVTPKATIAIDAFSPRTLMQQLGIEAPVTADAGALGKVIVDATADVSEKAIALTSLELVLDDTRFTGSMSVPRGSSGAYRLDLVADNIDLNRYMTPAGEAAEETPAEQAPVEIPAELIRPLRARGSLRIGEVLLGAMPLQNVELVLNTADGKMRLHPIAAGLFDGSYSGDIRLDVSGNTPVLSVNERIEGVNLSALSKAMFDKENVSGQINGTYQLTGRGADMAAIQKTLNGSMTFDLADGAWQGTDLWYELRRARALFKREAPPEPRLPARTEFSSVKATGQVTDGIFRNDDLLAELPFMRVTGKGTVNLPEATVDYGLTARVLEKPEFVSDATEAELEEFTEAVIPLKITGPLASPSIKPDVGEMLKKEVEQKVKDEILDKLLGGEKKPAEGEAEGQPAEEKDVEDEIKDALKDLLKR